MASGIFFSPNEYQTINKVLHILRNSTVTYKESIYETRRIGGGLGSMDDDIHHEHVKVGERDQVRKPTIDELISYFEQRLEKSKELDDGIV
ncbi:hypothetical protein RsoM2USA_123 [Ralstonia phage RsoM2USA]|nr:hypothetical protein RsoM2USA_123 [Ralstonia phage RsoM2USA]